jgi:uncharacterized NAD(P)/FAD-binding protein YdhS
MAVTNADAALTAAGAGPYRVGIVGGGASGALVAARLLRDATRPLAIVVFEPRADLGKGVAYETQDPLHLLNVPACNMSALPEDSDHFRRWARCEATAFVTRGRYGEYLQALLRDAVAGAGAGTTLTHVRDVVIDLGVAPRPWVVTRGDGIVEFDVLVLASGHDEPILPAVMAGLPSKRITSNPWLPGALDAIKDGDDVLVVGTGLTFVDVALTILDTRPTARVHAISRYGLLPQAHEDPWRPAHSAPELSTKRVDPRIVLDYVRSFGEDWRRGIDSLRSVTSALWIGMDDATRDSFVRHLARYWNVHRHRMAPEVARVFEAAMSAGRIELQQSSVARLGVVEDRLRAELSNGAVLDVDHVIVCTGPSGDMTRNLLGRTLIQHGIAQPGPLGVGYLIDTRTGALIAEAGHHNSTILTIGPLRRGVLWESIAMPEIRVQAAEMADAILSRAERAAVRG